MSRTFFAHLKRDAAAPAFVLSLCSSLFDMRLLGFGFTAVCGPQMIKANKPRSIIYAVIFHEVYFALAELPGKNCSGLRGARIPQSSLPRLLFARVSLLLAPSRGWLPNQYLRHIRPLTSPGKPSCDGSTSEFRIVDLIKM